jgi:hypothetical protein
MPPANRHSAQDSQGPIEQSLTYTKEILTLEARLRTARVARRFFRISATMLPLGIIGLYVLTDLTWHKINLRSEYWPAIIVFLALIAYIIAYLSLSPEYGSVPQIELNLELARERKRLHAAAVNLDLHTRQLIYRDGAPVDIDRFQSESKYYRRVHNLLQSVIIVGSLGASTLTSLIQSNPQLRWFAVATTFAVGVSAGFAGYFKFRERSFYLQVTADAIEQELSAVTLGIGRYRGKPEEEAMAEFTEQTELLKIEQKKRQQQLEQPSGGRDSVQ